ncbi:MAG: DUF4255 domain-containing protein [Crocinitomix sp.]|nr:DUF4255 domain-containing protein [Crocinitomix sp.]
MINKAIVFLNQQINDYLKLVLDLEPLTNKIILGNVVDSEGKVNVESNTLKLTLVNIEEEFAIQPNRSFVKQENGSLGKLNPGLHLNLYLLITAHFKEYDEALKCLSHAIAFFQTKNTFRKDNTPELEALGVERMEVKLFKNSFELQNQLWGALGAKYMPSVMYKMGVIQIQNEQITESIPLVESLNTNLTKL